MSHPSIIITATLVLHILVVLLLLVRVLLRPHRQPAARMAWVVVILALPVAGIFAYLFFGEVNIGRSRASRLREIIEGMPDFPEPASGDEANMVANVATRYVHLFRVGQSISKFDPVGGNSAQLLADSNAVIDSMVADIDAARHHVHLLFYIWLPDNNGCKVVEALKRAAGRGVKCRAMADDIGSRIMIHSEHWKAMRDAGVDMGVALPVGNPLLRPLTGRIDLGTTVKLWLSTDASPTAVARTAPTLSSASSPNMHLG